MAMFRQQPLVFGGVAFLVVSVIVAAIVVTVVLLQPAQDKLDSSEHDDDKVQKASWWDENRNSVFIGTGFSLVLVIVIGGLFAKRQKLFCFTEPVVHVHHPVEHEMIVEGEIDTLKKGEILGGAKDKKESELEVPPQEDGKTEEEQKRQLLIEIAALFGQYGYKEDTPRTKQFHGKFKDVGNRPSQRMISLITKDDTKIIPQIAAKCTVQELIELHDELTAEVAKLKMMKKKKS